jgi:hypothetical protein
MQDELDQDCLARRHSVSTNAHLQSAIRWRLASLLGSQPEWRLLVTNLVMAGRRYFPMLEHRDSGIRFADHHALVWQG